MCVYFMNIKEDIVFFFRYSGKVFKYLVIFFLSGIVRLYIYFFTDFRGVKGVLERPGADHRLEDLKISLRVISYSLRVLCRSQGSRGRLQHECYKVLHRVAVCCTFFV